MFGLIAGVLLIIAGLIALYFQGQSDPSKTMSPQWKRQELPKHIKAQRRRW